MTDDHLKDLLTHLTIRELRRRLKEKPEQVENLTDWETSDVAKEATDD